MKKIITILTSCSILSLGCASPLPETPIVLSWDASPDAASGVVQGYCVYEYTPGHVSWTVLTNVPVSVGSIVLVNPQYGTLYCMTATNSTAESPMSNVVTNNNLGKPGALKISR